mmetsp:Transcript_24979/g.77125  ORF Transcript_24979/g.77125 Transcript_24979/m.77125 type:complete len:205 (+) Transcript_24979:513-1127(+)
MPICCPGSTTAFASSGRRPRPASCRVTSRSPVFTFKQQPSSTTVVVRTTTRRAPSASPSSSASTATGPTPTPQNPSRGRAPSIHRRTLGCHQRLLPKTPSTTKPSPTTPSTSSISLPTSPRPSASPIIVGGPCDFLAAVEASSLLLLLLLWCNPTPSVDWDSSYGAECFACELTRMSSSRALRNDGSVFCSSRLYHTLILSINV